MEKGATSSTKVLKKRKAKGILRLVGEEFDAPGDNSGPPKAIKICSPQSPPKRQKTNAHLANRLATPKPTGKANLYSPLPVQNSLDLDGEKIQSSSLLISAPQTSSSTEADSDEQYYHYTHTPKRRKVRKSHPGRKSSFSGGESSGRRSRSCRCRVGLGETMHQNG